MRTRWSSLSLCLLLAVVISVYQCHAWKEKTKVKVDDPYEFFCGSDSCYDLLELPRSAPVSDVKKAFRELSRKYHPDKNKETGAKRMFELLRKAHDVLTDIAPDGLREKFEYYLDHPREYYKVSGHFSMKDIPKSDVGIVVAGVVILISVLMYVIQSQRYQDVVKKLKIGTLNNLGPKNGGSKYTLDLYRKAVDRYEAKIKEKDKEKDYDKGNKGKDKHLSKMRFDPLFEVAVDEVIAEINIGGSHRKPMIQDIFVVQLIMLPYTLFLSAKKYYRRHFSGAQLTEDELWDMAMERVGGRLWDSLDEAQQTELVNAKIWKPEVYQAWLETKQKEEQEMMKKLAKKNKKKGYIDEYSDEEYD